MIMSMNSICAAVAVPAARNSPNASLTAARSSPTKRADEAAEAVACLPGALDVARFADAGVEQHLFEFGEVGGRQRLALAQLVQHDVVLVRLQEMPGLLLEACEIGLADLRQVDAPSPSPISSAKLE